MSSDLRKDLLDLADKYNYNCDWVNPEWEPITKVPEDDRRLFLFILNRCLGVVSDNKDLGVTKVTWTGCNEERCFFSGPDDLMKEMFEELKE